MSAQAPVGTTLAILERTLKVMSAVQSRIHYAMKQEFRLLKTIIKDYTPADYSYDPATGSKEAKRGDYDMVEVIPVSDPNAATMSQKVVQYQAVMQLAQANPDIYDLPELNRQMLEVLGVKNVTKLIPNKEDIKPTDPVSENMNLINGKPVKAFIYQDHEAHITSHMTFKDDPKLAQLVGQSPKAQVVGAAIEAHIAEHLAFEYRRQIEEQLGVPLPAPNETLPQDIEVDVSRLAARAAKQLMDKNRAEIAQQQAQQQQEDPLIQMQQKELQIKEMEAQAKAQKMQADTILEQAKLDLEKLKLDSQERIAGAKLGADAVNKQKDLDAKEFIEGTKLGAQAVQQDKQLRQQSQLKPKGE
jgi:hypothetical protein